MNSSNKSAETTSNLFGNTLRDLFDATRNKLSRKEWAVLLGVSEAAISQWLKGKTFPEAEKLETVISIFEKYELDTFQQEKFDHLMAILELPANMLWTKIPSRMRNQKASDYILDGFHQEISSTASVLFYELKVELYNQFSRLIETHKELLTELLLKELKKTTKSLYERVETDEKLAGTFCKAEYQPLFREYVEKVRIINTECVDVIKGRMAEKDDKGLNRRGKFRKIDNSITGTTCRWETYSSVKNRLDNCLSLLPGIGAAGLYHTQGTWMMDRIFAAKAMSGNNIELSFHDPSDEGIDLMNIKVSWHENTWREKSLNDNGFCYVGLNYTNDAQDGRRIESSWSVNDQNSEGKRVFISRPVDPKINFEMLFDLQPLEKHRSDEMREITRKNLVSMFGRSESAKNARDRIRSFLIGPEHTNSQYVVEILNIESDKKIKKSTNEPGTVFVLLGEIGVKTPKMRKGSSGFRHLKSYFDKDTQGVKDQAFENCTAVIQPDMTIESLGGDSIALFITKSSDKSQ